MSKDPKVFPLRLPPHFHGVQKPFRRLVEIEREKRHNNDNPQYIQNSVSKWQTKRLDRDILRERKEFIVHPAKISLDSPDWFKNTLHHFHRNNLTQRSNKFEPRYDIFNRSREDAFAETFQTRTPLKMRSTQRDVTDKVGGFKETHYGTERWSVHKAQVTPKIGSVDRRDYSVPRPTLKIGQTFPDNFVNTYTIA